MNVRIIIAALVGAAVIVGGVLIFESGSTPLLREEITADRTLPATERSTPENDAPRPVPTGWQRYESESPQFTLDYPTGWSYRTEDEAGTTLSFSPPARAFQEVEPNPRIILTRIPLVNVLGTYESVAAWFEGEVLKNIERWDTRADTLAENPRYAFTEGVGEYPQENIIIMHGAAAYWFTIEASDTAMHELLPQIASSLQF